MASPKKGPRKIRKSTSDEVRLQLPRVHSSKLKSFRDLVETSATLEKIVGSIVKFHMVVDANVLIGQIIWSSKRKNPAGMSQLHESILAGTIVVYATTRVVNEVEKHLCKIADDKGGKQEVFLAEWLRFKPLLQVQDPDDTLVTKYAGGQDPTDAPTLALAEALNVSGILSKDTDIAAMGGKTIPDSFITAARDYSREKALNVSIQIGGYFIVVGGGHALMSAISVLKTCSNWLRGSRSEVKLILFAAVALCLVHPRSRNSIVSVIKTLGQSFPNLTIGLLQCALFVCDMLEANPAIPPVLQDHIQKKP